jgi:hypothetical protein
LATAYQLLPWVIGMATVVLTVVWGLWSTRDLAFNAARWQAAEPGKSSRLPMARWLAKKQFLRGKTRDEVLSLLGAPSDAPWSQFSNWDFTFDLHECTFALQSLALALRFDEQGRVTDCQIVGE